MYCRSQSTNFVLQSAVEERLSCQQWAILSWNKWQVLGVSSLGYTLNGWFRNMWSGWRGWKMHWATTVISLMVFWLSAYRRGWLYPPLFVMQRVYQYKSHWIKVDEILQIWITGSFLQQYMSLMSWNCFLCSKVMTAHARKPPLQ